VDTVIVEVLTRWGQVRSRHRLSTFPATIGRAPTCDVILDEADVSATHARVVRADDGSLVLEDAGSTNGVRVHRRRVPRVTLGARTDVHLGSAHLRLVSTSAPVEKTVTFRISRLDRPSAAALAFGCLALQVLVTEALLPATRVRGVEVLNTLVAQALFCAAWAFGWSLASRVAQGHFRYLGHLSVATLGLSAAVVLGDLVEPAIAFVLRLNGVVAWGLAFVVGAAPFTWVLAHHLLRVSSWSARTCVTIAGALWLGVTTVAGIDQWSKASRYSAELPLDGKTFPPALLLGPSTTPAALAREVPTLVEEVDAVK